MAVNPEPFQPSSQKDCMAATYGYVEQHFATHGRTILPTKSFMVDYLTLWLPITFWNSGGRRHGGIAQCRCCHEFLKTFFLRCFAALTRCKMRYEKEVLRNSWQRPHDERYDNGELAMLTHLWAYLPKRKIPSLAPKSNPCTFMCLYGRSALGAQAAVGRRAASEASCGRGAGAQPPPIGGSGGH